MAKIYYSQDEASEELEKSVVTIGNFDGMHIGHQAIFAEASAEAKQRGATAVALTFEPHPGAFFRPDKSPARLSPPPYKFDVMGRYGVDAIVALTFDEGLATQSPQEFVEGVLIEGLKACHVVVGEDFRFGKKRAGDTDSLKELGGPLGMTRTVAESVEWNDEVISSTRIRGAIDKGDMKAAEAMLGRAYRLYGEVVHGEERGRKLGFPTANVEVVDMALVPVGVYITTLAAAGGEHWRAITNVGHRPTFGGGALTVETFVLDDRPAEDLDLYGDDVELDVYRRVRGEEKFDSPKELIAQINKDVQQARDFFDAEGFDGS